MGAKIRFDRDAWWVVVHHRGRRWKKRVGGDKRLAGEVAKQIQARLVLGEYDDGKPAEDAPVLFQDFATRWLRTEVVLPSERGIEGSLAPNSVRQRGQTLRTYLLPFFGPLDVRKIRVADVQRFYDERIEAGEPRSPRTLEIVLGTLRRILLHAQAQELVATNAVSDWKELRGRRRGIGIRALPRERVLTGSELAQLLAVARDDFSTAHPLVLFLADTGCRIGEAIGLRWSDVNFDASTARIERSIDHLGRIGPTKTRRARVVELSSRLDEVLAARRPEVFGERTLVFPNATGNALDSRNFANREFGRLVRRALGPARHATPHDLRHSWVSHHLAAGTPIKWIQERGGWTTAKVLLDVYGHFMPSETRGYADVIAHANAPQAHPLARGVNAPRRALLAKSLPRQREGWSRRPDSNRRPADYESAALPAELRRPGQVREAELTRLLRRGHGAAEARRCAPAGGERNAARSLANERLRTRARVARAADRV